VGLLVVVSGACIESSSSDNGTSSGSNGASSSSSGSSGADSGREAVVEDLAPDSSPLVERASLCEVAATKTCSHGYDSIEECESALLGTNPTFIDALTKCVEGAATCDWDGCWKTAKTETAPGYPDVPLIKDCKRKNEDCEYTFDPATPIEKRKAAIDTVCEELVVLDEKRVDAAKACQAKDCDAFSQCIVDITTPESGAAEAWHEEIERRGAEVDNGTAATMTVEEYRAHVRQRRAARSRT
jgi:hypothetical protein